MKTNGPFLDDKMLEHALYDSYIEIHLNPF